MTIKSLPHVPEDPQGVIFWWSNILRSYQLRAYLPSGPLEPEIHRTRAEVEESARSLAQQHNVDIFEIHIMQISDGLEQ